jgi:hypothetical protein
MLGFELLQDNVNGGLCAYGDKPSVSIATENL